MKYALCGMVVFLIFSDIKPVFSQNREITKISGDLYRFRNNNHYSVFLVTSEGIITTDPINKEAATWLKQELSKRFNQPVRYLIYSHDHGDHIGGGEVFEEEAVVVGHELTKSNIISNDRKTAIPDITFKDRMTLELGGKTVELIYPGKSHSDNCIIVNFPAERTVFVVDFITVKRLPYQTLNGNFMPDWVEAIKMVEAIDFDILAPGHAELGTKQDAADHRKYIEELYAAVENASKSGKSLEEIKESLKMEKYKDWGQFEAWLPLNIEGMYRMIKGADD